MAKRPTVYDVAALANVSTATVSFTYSKPARVKRETRELVLAAAKTLGYVPSASARGLAAGRTGVLGLYSFDLFLDDSGSDRVTPSRRAPSGGNAVPARAQRHAHLTPRQRVNDAGRQLNCCCPRTASSSSFWKASDRGAAVSTRSA